MTFDPSICQSQHLVNQDKIEYPENLALVETLGQLGVKWSGQTAEMDDTIQPRIQAKIYKENFEEDKLSKSTKTSYPNGSKQRGLRFNMVDWNY